MFYSPNISIDTFLIHASHVFHYLENQPEALALLARYGMDGVRLQEGKALLMQVQNSHWTMRNQRRQQKASTTSFHTDWGQARLFYQRHRQAARDVLGPDASQLLQKGQRNYAGWLAQAQEFYSALLNNPSYLEQLAAIDIPADQLLRVSQLINAMVANKMAQTQNREGSRTSKQARDLQLNEAKDWFAVLMAAARVAFRRQPGMLEAIDTLPEHLSQEEKEKKKAKAEAAKLKKAALQVGQ
ncbi:MAG: hypothetical protein U0175_28400 [Caldilineaceae bacterium]